jgi:TrmH family RNA methyltransferase
MGAQFILPVHERVDLAIALQQFDGTVIGTSPRASQTIYDVDLSGPVAMIFGSEGRGLAGDVLSYGQPGREYSHGSQG